MLNAKLSNPTVESTSKSSDLPKVTARRRMGLGRRLNGLRKEVLACGPLCNGGCCCCCNGSPTMR